VCRIAACHPSTSTTRCQGPGAKRLGRGHGRQDAHGVDQELRRRGVALRAALVRQSYGQAGRLRVGRSSDARHLLGW
jgi:hypothetical protein